MKDDPLPLPAWVLDPETAYPCPCGEEMIDEYVVMTGEKGFLRLFHPWCIDEYIELNEGDYLDDE